MKKPVVISNWKMNPGFKNGGILIDDILKLLKKSKKKKELSNIDVVFCPPFTNLPEVANKIKRTEGLFWGAQDCFWEEKGEFTGEISPVWLKEMGCQYVILGHSERRLNLGETDEMVHKKVRAALQVGLIPIVCVGETFEQRQKGLKDYVILEQTSRALDGINLKPEQKIIVVYEPIWVIGSGQAVAPDDAEYTGKVLLQRMIDIFGLMAKDNIWILYGGSVDPTNIKSFIEQPSVDGVLVGSVSLKPEEFVKMCEVAVEKEIKYKNIKNTNVKTQKISETEE